MAERTLWLGEATWTDDALRVEYGVDERPFTTTLRWDGLAVDALAGELGADAMRRIAFHVAAFEAMKGASLAPSAFDLGPYADLGTGAFRLLWSTVHRQVWGQWRYEHDRPDDPGPEIIGAPAASAGPFARAAAARQVLLFCGGGKDSLVAARVLDEAGVPYASYAYAHSVYGPAQPQHDLIDGLLDHLDPVQRFRHRVDDELLAIPVAELAPELGLRSVTAAETPASLFGALPVALAQGCTDLVLGHERSADAANLVWDRTGEAVNHQWGKSLAAERVLRDYVRDEMVAGLSYSSVLKPAHDVLIFRALRESLDAVPATHSCNVAKPWCLRCAKCAYVWLGYQALLPAEVNRSTFGDVDLLDDPVNLVWFEQMLGLAAHTPFECIGQVEETRLFFELLRRQGRTGAAMELFQRRVGAFDADRAYADLIAIDHAHHAMPEHLAVAVVPVLERLASLPLDGDTAGDR